MKEKIPIRLGKGKLLPKTEKPSLKNHSLRNWPTLARAQAKSGGGKSSFKLILVGAMGKIYKGFTDKPLADLNLDYHKIKN